eukprot:Colp12_sorted_trinity150504_noHs@2293
MATGRPRANSTKFFQRKTGSQLHEEQNQKLTLKNAQETEILEEIRAFVKKRADIELKMAQDLLALTEQTLTKRKWPASPKLPSSDGEHKTAIGVWKIVLEETEKFARQRQAVAQGLQEKIVEPIKPLHKTKQHLLRKGVEHCIELQRELTQADQELEKKKKVYIEKEKISQLAGEKYNELEERTQTNKKKTLRFLESKGELQKKLKKSLEKLMECEKQAQAARHDCMFSIEATNAHHNHYYSVYLPSVMSSIDSDYFTQVQNFFKTYAALELECIKQTEVSAQHISAEAGLISREYENQGFLLENLQIFSVPPPLKFEPFEKDKNTEIVIDENSQRDLNDKAKKLAAQIERNKITIASKLKALQATQQMLQASEAYTKTGDTAQEEGEAKIEEIKKEIRILELKNVKFKAIIDKLISIGMTVETPTAEDAAAADDWDLTSEQDVPVQRQTSGARDDTIDEDDEFRTAPTSARTSIMTKAVAIYEYRASNSEELNMDEDEELTVVEPDSDGWCMVRNSRGETGLVPTSYIELQDAPPVPPPPMDGGLVDRVIAVYDYNFGPEGGDELNFKVGDIIEVISREETEDNEGYWRGRLNGLEGYFNKLLVEDYMG